MCILCIDCQLPCARRGQEKQARAKKQTTITVEIKVAWGLAPQVWPGALLAECRKRPAKARTKRAAQGARFPFARVSLAQLGKDRWQKAGWPCCRRQGHSARRIAEAYDRGGRKYLGNRYSRLLMSKILPAQQCLIMTLRCLCLRPLPLQPPRSMLGASNRQGECCVANILPVNIDGRGDGGETKGGTPLTTLALLLTVSNPLAE